jgi:hypothetical protein
MRIQRILPTAALLATLFCSSFAAQANSILYTATNGEGKALFTTGNGFITIQLTDLVVNPTDVADNLSALIFTLSSAPGVDSISSSSALTRTVNGNGVGGYTDGGSVAPGWAFSSIGATISLNDLTGGAAGPAHTLIGSPNASNAYSNANGSIKGNGAHNPFLDGTATWTISAANVTSSTNITAATFQFGTTDGAGRVGSTGVSVATPEPATISMLLGGFGLLALSRRRRVV